MTGYTTFRCISRGETVRSESVRSTSSSSQPGRHGMLTQICLDNRINSFLGRPGGADKRPAVIHLHERYGIVQHTTNLAHKLVDAGYVTVVPDLFSRFTGDRQALARGDSRVGLRDEEVVQDVDAIVTYLRTL